MVAHANAGAGTGRLPREAYARAEQFLPWHADRLIARATVEPNWLDGGRQCWYRVSTPEGHEFVLVDTEAGTRRPAFDHHRLAAGLAAASGHSCSPTKLPLARVQIDLADSSVTFEAFGARWRCGLDGAVCQWLGPAEPVNRAESRSPDGRHVAFVRDHNLWLRSTEGGADRQITRDGAPGRAWATPIASPLLPAGIAKAETAPPLPVLWSPDSRRLVTHVIDDATGQRLDWIQSSPLDGSLRPKHHSAVYPLPGDDPVPGATLAVIEVETGAVQPVGVEPLPMLYYGSPLLQGPPSGVGSALTSRWIWWRADASRLYVLRKARGFQSYALFEADPTTGAARELVRETATSGIDPAPTSAAAPCVHVLANGEVIWFSQRDGWGHLYLFDGRSPEPIRQLTRGAWDVAEIAHVDEAGRQLYFTAGGREPGDPYLQRLYRVSLDSGKPTLLTPEAAEHTIAAAPDGRTFVDTYSTVAEPPVTVLRRADGTVAVELERADISALTATGWQPPERFCVKARDGVTDIYGVLIRPSGWDGAATLPVLDYIYGGPQVNQAPAGFVDVARGRTGNYWQAQALAELGFAVVLIDGLGMPYRGKAYHDVSYRNVADGGLPDHIAGLRQLADRYPYLDLERVGIFGHSAGGYASARAILAYPDFFKVAVSSAGLHHHRWDKATWNERYSGPYAPHYEEQANTSLAANLKGKLFLAHGEMDENVHPFNTLRLVDALIKANKDFELLILPNRPHSCFADPYLVRRRWDYFVRHLLHLEPPSEYRVAPPEEAAAS